MSQSRTTVNIVIWLEEQVKGLNLTQRTIVNAGMQRPGETVFSREEHAKPESCYQMVSSGNVHISIIA